MCKVSLAAAVAVLCLCPVAALSQPAPGHIGMYFDALGTQSSGTIFPFVGFDTYVVVAIDDDLSLFEFTLEVPAEVTVLGATGGAPLCLGPGCGPIDWQTGPIGCPTGPTLALVTLHSMVVANEVGVDLPFCVRRLSWSTLDTPGYRTCSNELKPLSLAPSPYGNPYQGCALANPTVVAVPTPSWGSLKGRFAN